MPCQKRSALQKQKDPRGLAGPARSQVYAVASSVFPALEHAGHVVLAAAGVDVAGEDGLARRRRYPPPGAPVSACSSRSATRLIVGRASNVNVITGSPRLSTAWLIAKVTKRENPSAASAHGSK